MCVIISAADDAAARWVTLLHTIESIEYGRSGVRKHIDLIFVNSSRRDRRIRIIHRAEAVNARLCASPLYSFQATPSADTSLDRALAILYRPCLSRTEYDGQLAFHPLINRDYVQPKGIRVASLPSLHEQDELLREDDRVRWGRRERAFTSYVLNLAPTAGHVGIVRLSLEMSDRSFRRILLEPGQWTIDSAPRVRVELSASELSRAPAGAKKWFDLHARPPRSGRASRKEGMIIVPRRYDIVIDQTKGPRVKRDPYWSFSAPPIVPREEQMRDKVLWFTCSSVFTLLLMWKNPKLRRRRPGVGAKRSSL